MKGRARFRLPGSPVPASGRPLAWLNDREGSGMPVVVAIGGQEHQFPEDYAYQLLWDLGLCLAERGAIDASVAVEGEAPKPALLGSWPKKKADWVGLRVEVGSPLTNGWGTIPRGAILTITSVSHGKVHLKGRPCDRCNVKTSITLRGNLKRPPMELWPLAPVDEDVA